MALKDLATMKIKPLIFEMALSKLPKELNDIVNKLRNMSVDEIKEMFAGIKKLEVDVYNK